MKSRILSKDTQQQEHNPNTSFKVCYMIPVSWAERVYAYFFGVHTSRHVPHEKDQKISFVWDTIISFLHKQGALTKVRIDKPFEGLPRLFSVTLYSAFNPSKTDSAPDITEGKYARGVSLESSDEALSKAIGELLERYSLMYYKNASFLRGSAQHLRLKGLDFLDPRTLPIKLSNEDVASLTGEMWDDQSILQWTEARCLNSEKVVLVPAQLVFWNYQTLLDEPRLQQSTTNGGAGMFSWDSAVLSGLYELIQRDAFLNFWHTKTTPPQIDLRSIQSPQVKQLLEACRICMLDVYVQDTTLDLGIFSCSAIIIDKNRKDLVVSCGGGSDFNVESAILKSITEALTMNRWQRENVSPPNTDERKEISSDGINTPLAHAIFWSKQETLTEIEWFLMGEKSPVAISKDNMSATTSVPSLDQIVQSLGKKGSSYNVYVYTVQSNVLKRLGYHVVKVVIPALTPLYFAEQYASFETPRVKYLQNQGYLKHRQNITPHPFP